ncbi:polyketide cyclase [Brachybacterium sp. P6-10-X1]|uniref:SRPBCC family protein n=1 Tax=Brachybacterium sp. P6-10-X1 TaxID=1903186 RepID=UPI0009717615|nr:SRPBCC family protein [Brachybacterium sp. P6-10-X1]APX34120.1 polyketide cyclase [Brachybacterium sp. P6-10-X1]
MTPEHLDQHQQSEQRVVSASREITAPAERIFALIADPAEQPRWDGNDNLADAAPGQRVRAVGDVFVMTLTKGAERANHVVEFEEGRLIAWQPGEVDGPTFGQLWRWELEPAGEGSTHVTHTYDWTDLHRPEARLRRARSTTVDTLRASLDRLADVAESGAER